MKEYKEGEYGGGSTDGWWIKEQEKSEKSRTAEKAINTNPSKENAFLKKTNKQTNTKQKRLLKIYHRSHAQRVTL